ncbi:hypothetical protein BIW11_07979 [Tropilaelaps mercedesae]|uniref:Uncharacterized protein n=1 Tax=Tropilaelaps mercedesae TaxID=418985 RepID=A0A1V9XRJ7_9ACAR|nr:hypothetical protein BIW11_07979 [Tropilaelaps mercedesae]
MMDHEQTKENRPPGGQESSFVSSDSVAMSRLKVAQKQVEQLKSYEQKFFDEKERAEELETKILQGEKKLKSYKIQLQTMEHLIAEREEELSRAADKIVELQSRLEDEQIQRSFSRQRNRSEDTLDSVSGENVGEAVVAVLAEDQRGIIADLRDKLTSFEADLQSKEHDLAEAILNGNMKQEQIESQETIITSFRETSNEQKSLIKTLKKTIATLEARLAEKDKELMEQKTQSSELRDTLSKEVEDKEFMQEALNAASCTLSEREKYVAEMIQLIASLKSELNSMKEELATKDGSLKIIEAQLDEVSSAAKDMSDALSLLRKEKADLEEELDVANKTFLSLKEEVAVLVNRAKESDAAVLELRSERDTLVGQWSKIGEQVANLTKDLKAAREESAEAIAASKAAHQKLQKAKADMEANVQVFLDVSSLKDEMESLKKALAERQNECAIFRERSTSKEEHLDRVCSEIESLQAEISQKTCRIADLERAVEPLERSIQRMSEEIRDMTASLATSEQSRIQAETLLQECAAEKQQLTKDMDNNLEQFKEFTNEIQNANAAKDQLEKANRILKIEQRKLTAEVERLRANAAIEASEHALKLKNFKKSLANLLEKIDIQAPIMDQGQLLGVVEMSVETVKRAKQLEAENRTLQRLAANSEAEVQGRITLLISEADQLKRKLRESAEQLKRTKDELTEVETAVIKAKAGDTVDGGIISMLARDIMNLAVSAQENRTTKGEVTQLRLQLVESNGERDRLREELEMMENVREEAASLRKQKVELMQEVTSMRQEKLENHHEHTMDILREGHDLEEERLRKELNQVRLQLQSAESELQRKDEYISTLLDKYDNAKQYSERKISGLHGILHQNNISLPKPRRKSPNQPGLPVPAVRPNVDDEHSRRLRDKDEEIRRLKLAKRELEKMVCAKTIMERSRMNDSTGFVNSVILGHDADEITEQRSCMPPPQAPPVKEQHSAFEGRAWQEFREPSRYSISSLSDGNFDSSFVKSMPAYRQSAVYPVPHSYSSRSLLEELPETPLRQTRVLGNNIFGKFSAQQQQQQAIVQSGSSHFFDMTVADHGSMRMSTYEQKAIGSSSRSLMPDGANLVDKRQPPAMLEKSFPSQEMVRRISSGKISLFDDIGNALNYKYDLSAAAALEVASAGENRAGAGRVGGLSGLGMGDDEEAQFMNPKNLEELERDEPQSPSDSSRGLELLQRNQQVPPHLRSSYPVETQSGKVPVTPLLKKSFK